MPTWYYIFLTFCVVFVFLGVKSDKFIWATILAMTLLSMVIGKIWLSKYNASWEMLVHGGIETLTIVILCMHKKSLLAQRQIKILSVAWLLHFFYFVNLLFGGGRHIAYHIYNYSLFSVAIGQIFLGGGSILHIIENARRFFRFTACLPFVFQPSSDYNMDPLQNTERPEETKKINKNV